MSKQFIYLVFTVDLDTKEHSVHSAYAIESEAMLKARNLSTLMEYRNAYVLEIVLNNGENNYVY